MDAEQLCAQATDAFNAHDEAAMRRHWAEDGVLEAPGGARLEGLDAIVSYAMAWIRAFPDAHLEVKARMASGDTVVHEMVFHGTHQGTLVGPQGEIPPTGRSLDGRAVQVFRVRDGKIVEEHLYFDEVDVMSQLGLMPDPARA